MARKYLQGILPPAGEDKARRRFAIFRGPDTAPDRDTSLRGQVVRA